MSGKIYLKIKPGEKFGIVEKKYKQGMRISPVDVVKRHKLTDVGYLIFPDRECTEPKQPSEAHVRMMLEQNPHLLTDKPTPFDSLQVQDPPQLRKLRSHNQVVYPPGYEPIEGEAEGAFNGGQDAVITPPEMVPFDLKRVTQRIDTTPEAAAKTIETLRDKDLSKLQKMHMAKWMKALGREVVVPLEDDEYKQVLVLVAAEVEKELAG
jgi:hypothetical protein